MKTNPLDIKADNIMFDISDESVSHDFKEEEFSSPLPRKEVDGKVIYMSRQLAMPKQVGAPVLCDFGSAVVSTMDHSEDV